MAIKSDSLQGVLMCFFRYLNFFVHVIETASKIKKKKLFCSGSFFSLLKNGPVFREWNKNPSDIKVQDFHIII